MTYTIPDEVMSIFNKWCTLLNYPVTDRNFELFADDCFINFVEFEGHVVEYELEDNNDGLCFDSFRVEINGYCLYSIPYDQNMSIVKEMKDKLDEITRN